MATGFDEKKAESELKKGYKEAEEMLKDPDKVEEFLQRLEEKLKVVPAVGNTLAYIPAMASLVRSYIKKEYTKVPIGTILAILAALIYFVSPIDLIPDAVPVVGYIDDAAVVLACWKLVESDVKEYTEWRKKNGKVID